MEESYVVIYGGVMSPVWHCWAHVLHLPMSFSQVSSPVVFEFVTQLCMHESCHKYDGSAGHALCIFRFLRHWSIVLSYLSSWRISMWMACVVTHTFMSHICMYIHIYDTCMCVEMICDIHICVYRDAYIYIKWYTYVHTHVCVTRHVS